MVVPAALLDAVRHEKALSDQTTARIEQHALADFIGRGELDRHLRRMRLSYRARRDATIAALRDALPDATVSGIAAGLHLTVTLAAPVDEDSLRAECARRRVEISTISDYTPGAFARQPTLLLGYAQVPEPAIAAGDRRARRRGHGGRPGLEVELVGRVLAPGGARAVVEAGGVARGMARRVLDRDERHAAVEQHRHEGVAELVRADPVDLPVLVADDPGVLGQLAEQPVDRLAVVRDARGGRAAAQPPAVLAAEDRALRAGADRSSGRRARCAR